MVVVVTVEVVVTIVVSSSSSINSSVEGYGKTWRSIPANGGRNTTQTHRSSSLSRRAPPAAQQWKHNKPQDDDECSQRGSDANAACVRYDSGLFSLESEHVLRVSHIRFNYGTTAPPYAVKLAATFCYF